MHRGFNASAHGFGPEFADASFADEDDGDGDGDRHDGDADGGRSAVVSELAVEQRDPSRDGEELGGRTALRSVSEPGDNGGDVEEASL